MTPLESIPEPIVIPHAQPPAKGPDASVMFLLPDQMQWRKLVPAMGDASPKLAVVHHEPRTGATAMLIWTPPGFHVPRSFLSALSA